MLVLIVAEFRLWSSRERSRFRSFTRPESGGGREKKGRKRTKIERHRDESTWEQRTLRTGRQGVRVVPFIWTPLPKRRSRVESATLPTPLRVEDAAVAINKPLGLTCCRPPDRTTSSIMPRVENTGTFRLTSCLPVNWWQVNFTFCYFTHHWQKTRERERDSHGKTKILFNYYIII